MVENIRNYLKYQMFWIEKGYSKNNDLNPKLLKCTTNMKSKDGHGTSSKEI